jgi:hypothetical protein
MAAASAFCWRPTCRGRNNIPGNGRGKGGTAHLSRGPGVGPCDPTNDREERKRRRTTDTGDGDLGRSTKRGHSPHRSVVATRREAAGVSRKRKRRSSGALPPGPPTAGATFYRLVGAVSVSSECYFLSQKRIYPKGVEPGMSKLAFVVAVRLDRRCPVCPCDGEVPRAKRPGFACCAGMLYLFR